MAKEIKGYVVKGFVPASETHHTDNRNHAVKEMHILQAKHPDRVFQVAPVILRRPNLYTILLKTVVNLRFKLMKANSPEAAAEKMDQIMSGKHLADLFRHHNRNLAFREEGVGHVVLDYTEWAEEHQCALVDEERGELDDFDGSRWLQPHSNGWGPMIDADRNTYLEAAWWALNYKQEELGEALDLSDEVMKQLHERLGQYLNSKEESIGEEENSGQEGSEEGPEETGTE